MRILRAEHLGMCFGVRDAIAFAINHAATEPLTVLGDLVHNEVVLADLHQRGVRFQADPETVATKTVMITAHGASAKRINATRELGFNVVSAACPLVQVAHRAVRELVREGFYPVIVGQAGHVEVRGLTEDLPECSVVLSDADLEQLPWRPRYGVAAQTTQPIEKVRYLVSQLRRRFPDAEVRFVDTVCQPTKQRQHAAVDLARRCSVVLVIGGAHSNNTHELVKTCGLYCSRVHHIQTAADVRADWFQETDVVGVTAGTSTPDETIAGVEERLRVLERGLKSLAAISTR
ncbi:MAG: 4-hydroxy-3-methylbut-2-enyl diphosphate reductase [Verrucomicrobiota bacterium]